MNYIVAQLGARRHYAIPKMLNEEGMLSHFYTDICAVKGWPRVLHFLPSSLRPKAVKRLLGRTPVGLPVEKISALNAFGWEYRNRRVASKTQADIYSTHLWAGRKFCEMVLNSTLRDANGIYTFNSAGLELLVEGKKRGLRTVMEQTIAPTEIEIKLMMEEQERFPGWEEKTSYNKVLDEFMAREYSEWQQAEVILCGSEFVRDSIKLCGGPVDKCRVVPYSVGPSFSIKKEIRDPGRLRVLTVGAVGLRKGSPYVLEASRHLKGKVEFRMVGSFGALPYGINALSETVELLGAVPRSDILQHFAWADVFLLPSLCEGSATVVYEALAAGLPVICTPNTGSVVRDGVDGFIVPIRDVQAIIEKLILLSDNHDLLFTMRQNTQKNLMATSISQYQKRLIEAISF